jgi:hypothetical protein
MTDSPPSWSLHPQLEQDTEPIGDLPLSRLLVNNDANYPWLLLVPRRAGACEIIDLDDKDQSQLMIEIAHISRALRDRPDGLSQTQCCGNRQYGAAAPCSRCSAPARRSGMAEAGVEHSAGAGLRSGQTRGLHRRVAPQDWAFTVDATSRYSR